MKHAEIASELFSKRYFMGIWDFIQDEILGMKWLNRLIGSVLNACGLDTSGKIGGKRTVVMIWLTSQRRSRNSMRRSAS